MVQQDVRQTACKITEERRMNRSSILQTDLYAFASLYSAHSCLHQILQKDCVGGTTTDFQCLSLDRDKYSNNNIRFNIR